MSNGRSTAMARYESAIARAHRGVYYARQRAADLGWEVEEQWLTATLEELTQMGMDALKRQRRQPPQLEGQERLPF